MGGRCCQGAAAGRAPPGASDTATHPNSPIGATETIHTTANHPWLTADHGWLVAGSLHIGEAVRLLGGGTARVVALRALPGVGPMWNLSLDAVHTFAVGKVQAVVHNCPLGGGDDVDLTSPQRRTHILEWRCHWRGHRPGLGIPGKTEFPTEWSDDAIMTNISDVATDPNSTIQAGGNGRFVISGTRTVTQTGQQVEIRVIVSGNGDIITAYPTNLPRNP